MVAIPKQPLAIGIAFLLPVISVILLSVPPWHDWFPEARDVGRPWLYVTVAAGGMGLLLLPWTNSRKLAALTLYVPTMLLFLISLTVSVTCLAHGPQACP